MYDSPNEETHHYFVRGVCKQDGRCHKWPVMTTGACLTGCTHPPQGRPEAALSLRSSVDRRAAWHTLSDVCQSDEVGGRSSPDTQMPALQSYEATGMSDERDVLSVMYSERALLATHARPTTWGADVVKIAMSRAESRCIWFRRT